jgi:ribosomal protein L15E
MIGDNHFKRQYNPEDNSEHHTLAKYSNREELNSYWCRKYKSDSPKAINQWGYD